MTGAEPHYRLPPGFVLEPGWESYNREVPRLYLVGFDPGVETGWAALRIDFEKLLGVGFSGVALGNPDPDVFAWRTGVFAGPENHIVDQMMALVRGVWLEADFTSVELSDVMGVAIERFDLRMLSMDASLLSPVRLTAAFRYAARDVPVPMTGAFSPSDTKRVITDTVLHKLNLWVPGKDHRRDALRQAILLARKMLEPPYRARWLAACPWLRA